MGQRDIDREESSRRTEQNDPQPRGRPRPEARWKRASPGRPPATARESHKSVDILAIDAHMGDEVAWGAALAAHKRGGGTVGMLHVTPGEKGHPTMPPDEYAEQKRRESRACAKRLDAEIWTLNLKDGEVPAGDPLAFAIATVLRQARPKTVITHWTDGMHKDHRNVGRAMSDAIFYAAIGGFDLGGEPIRPPRPLYGENWEDQRDFNRSLLLELEPEDLTTWREAMSEYALFRGEWPTFEYLDYYEALARARGCEARCQYAIAFAEPERHLPPRVTSLI